jgi:hypothetical protein
MTKVITRYFSSAKRARMARKDLLFIERFPYAILHLIDDADGAADYLKDHDVLPETADLYAEKLGIGGAVLLVRAGFKPLGAAQTFRDVTAALGAEDLGVVEEVVVDDSKLHAPSVDPYHQLVMSAPRGPDDTNYYQANWPIPLISRRKPFTHSLVEPHAHMADVFWPLTIRTKPYSWSLFDDHARMANWPIGLISKRKPFDGFAFPRHSRMANFLLPLISRRKPYDKFAFPRHSRMATVPFPLLINGKGGTNAIIPGEPYMANFPIPLLSKRKPYDEFAFPRHSRMANFPFGLISRRKPITASIFPRHAHMANFPIPLVIRNAGKRGELTVSRLLGIPTLATR